MITRYFILFSLAGIIEIVFLALGMGTSVFSIFTAMIIIFLSTLILGIHFVNGRIVKLAIWFSFLHIVLGNIPIAAASQSERLRPVSAEFNGKTLSFLATIFQGPLDYYIFFWIGQSLLFTALFLGIFIIFSKLIRAVDIKVASINNNN